MKTSPPLILLVGMHRSGTSLAASLLQGLGVAVAGPWHAADVHNPEGYFEAIPVLDLQDSLLNELDRCWPTAAGSLPLPDGWLTAPCGQRAGARLSAFLQREASRQQGPWAIKDPRTSLLLPLWIQVTRTLGIPLRLVQVVRDPAAVMLSLLRRDSAPAGMTPLRAQQLWWHHHQSIHRDGLDLPLHTIVFEHWFDRQATAQLASLAQFCLDRPPEPAQLHEALSRIHPEHRHDQAPRRARPMPILHPLRRAYRCLSTSGRFPADAAEPRWRKGRLRRREPPLSLPRLPHHICLAVAGAEASHWVTHAWLNRCPLPANLRFSVERRAARVTLHLQTLALSEAQGRLPALRAQAIVLDPRLEQVEALREQGVNAFWIDPQAPSSGWLASYFDPRRCAERLGLPHPEALARGGEVLCLGGLGDEGERLLAPPLWALPRFDRLLVADVEEARLLASWLNQANRSGLQLVRLGASDLERHGNPWSALDPPDAPRRGDWLAAPRLEPPLTPRELLEELDWRRAGCPKSPCPTPTPQAETLWQWPSRSEPGQPQPQAAVCVSLYNYADCIERALDSVRRQTLRPLELIIVDDASTDDGVDRVRAWLERHGRELERVQLLRHRDNSGVAAARNTAFTVARAPWCLVLDADNELEAEALSHLLLVAQTCPDNTAVVHPMLELCGADGIPGHRSGSSLLEPVAWQARIFLEGNQIDALALVRRESWQVVGGYEQTNGWEDFDLWCRFIEAGLHGVICPQRLGLYHRHANSMQSRSSYPQKRRLTRLMQQRHPWLRIDKGSLR